MKLIPALAAAVLLAGCAATPGQVVTVTAPASSTSAPAPSSEPTPTKLEFTDQDLADMLRAEDFKVKIKVKKKQCFGSAGCNITFRIDPSYVGASDLPESGELEITYEVKGAEDPYTNYFTIDGEGTAHFDSEEDVSTASSSKKLTAKVTDVEWDG